MSSNCKSLPVWLKKQQGKEKHDQPTHEAERIGGGPFQSPNSHSLRTREKSIRAVQPVSLQGNCYKQATPGAGLEVPVPIAVLFWPVVKVEGSLSCFYCACPNMLWQRDWITREMAAVARSRRSPLSPSLPPPFGLIWQFFFKTLGYHPGNEHSNWNRPFWTCCCPVCLFTVVALEGDGNWICWSPGPGLHQFI